MKEKRKIDFVYVLDSDGKPLMPTRRFGKVRRMLRDGLARVVRRDVFTIQLAYESTHYTQPLALGCDTGFEHIGISVSSEKTEYYSEEVVIDNGMAKRLETRRMYRRDRRNRKTRFSNRVSSKKDGWLAPTVRHRRDTHIARICKACSILPVVTINIETTSFDIQKIKNPDIEGVGYQQGEGYGYENKRQYVLARDGYTCQHCHGKSGDRRKEVHHVKWRSQGGSDDVSNLITLCKTCHDAVHRGEIELKNRKHRSFAAAAGVSSMKNSLMRELRRLFPQTPINETFGYITKHRLDLNNIAKAHHCDAFAIAGNVKATQLDYHYLFMQKKRHERSLHVANYQKGGIRRSNIAPKYIKGSRFKRGDYVVCEGRRGFIYGSTNGYPFIKDINGKKITRKNVGNVRFLTFLRRQQGQYMVDIVCNSKSNE